MTEGAMSAFLTEIGTFFTQAMTWVTSVLDTIMAEPLLLVMCAGLPLCGFAVGLLGRLFNAR